MVKTVSFIILVFLGSMQSAFFEVEPLETKDSTVVFSSESFLKIKGKTNVTISEAISISYKDYDKRIQFKDTKLTLPNLEFNCGGKAINRDFNELLNTEEYPEIILKLKEISKTKIDTGLITATIEITISNIVRTYTIPISIANNEGLHVSGVMPLDINDFNLIAPTKMLGMVKVSPEIEIQFSLKIKES